MAGLLLNGNIGFSRPKRPNKRPARHSAHAALQSAFYHHLPLVRSTCCKKCYSIVSQWWDPPLFVACDHEYAIDHRAPVCIQRAAFYLALKTNVRLLSDKTTRAKRCVHYTRNYTNAHQVHSNCFVFVGLLKASEFYKRAIKNATRMHRDCAYPVIRISRCWERSVFLCVALLDRTPACIHNRKRNNNERQRTRAIFCKPAFQWAECRRARKQPLGLWARLAFFFRHAT